MKETSRFSSSGKPVVVTGGLGLIGQKIFEPLVHQGARTVIVDQGIDRWAAFRSERAEAKDMSFFAGDLADVEKLPDLVAEIDGFCGGA